MLEKCPVCPLQFDILDIESKKTMAQALVGFAPFLLDGKRAGGEEKQVSPNALPLTNGRGSSGRDDNAVLSLPGGRRSSCEAWELLGECDKRDFPGQKQFLAPRS